VNEPSYVPKTFFSLFFLSVLSQGADRPNVVLIICDDLNDYVETLGGHPQAKTANMKRLINRGVSFTQAHCTIPICNPSRTSIVFGLYPHTTRLYGFEK
jgi:choline-sulfatase